MFSTPFSPLILGKAVSSSGYILYKLADCYAQLSVHAPNHSALEGA